MAEPTRPRWRRRTPESQAIAVRGLPNPGL